MTITNNSLHMQLLHSSEYNQTALKFLDTDISNAFK